MEQERSTTAKETRLQNIQQSRAGLAGVQGPPNAYVVWAGNLFPARRARLSGPLIGGGGRGCLRERFKAFKKIGVFQARGEKQGILIGEPPRIGDSCVVPTCQISREKTMTPIATA